MSTELQAVLELVEKATPGEWCEAHRPTLNGGYATEVFDTEGHAIATLAWHSMPPRYEDGRTIISTDRAENAAAIAAAINYLRSDEFKRLREDAGRAAESKYEWRWFSPDERLPDPAHAPNPSRSQYGVVNHLAVTLPFPTADGGPEIRSACFCMALRGFFCNSTGTRLQDVAAWIYAPDVEIDDDDEA